MLMALDVGDELLNTDDIFGQIQLEPSTQFWENFEKTPIETFIKSIETEKIPFDLDAFSDDFFGSTFCASFGSTQLNQSLTSMLATSPPASSSFSQSSNVLNEMSKTTLSQQPTINVGSANNANTLYHEKLSLGQTRLIERSPRLKSANVKRKKRLEGTSLLVKPPKKTNGKRICQEKFKAYFYENHDYCAKDISMPDTDHDSKDSTSNVTISSINSSKNYSSSQYHDVDCYLNDFSSILDQEIINLDEFNYNNIDNCIILK